MKITERYHREFGITQLSLKNHKPKEENVSNWNQIRDLWDRGFEDEEIAEVVGVTVEEVSDLIDQWAKEEEDGQLADWDDEGYSGTEGHHVG